MCHYLSQLSHTVTHNYLTIPDGVLLGDGKMEEALNQQTHKMTNCCYTSNLRDVVLVTK